MADSKMSDAVALDIVAEILRTPEWGAWTVEDVALVVGRVRDIESLNRYRADGTDRADGPVDRFGPPEVGNLVSGRDRHSH